MRLKNLRILIAIISLFSVTRVTAQWTSDAAINTPTSTGIFSSTDRPDIENSTTDGSYFVRWVRYDATARYGYSMYVQKIDKRGNRLWGADGIRIDSLMGSGRYVDMMTCDNNGNLIVATQNTRLFQYQQFPVIYKIDGTTGDKLWTVNVDTLAGNNDYMGLAPVVAVSLSNDVIVTWNNSVLIGQSTRDGVFMQKINGSTGQYMWPSRIAIQDNIAVTGLFAQPVVISNSSVIVTWQHRPAGSAGSTPFNIVAQKYNLSTGASVWTAPTELSPSKLIAPGGACTYFDDKRGGIIVSYKSPSMTGIELYAQRFDTASGVKRWGDEAKLIARNVIGSSSDFAGVCYDEARQKLWFSVIQDEPNGGLHGDKFYLQGLDLSGKFSFGDSTKGALFLPISNGTAAKVRQTIGMKNTGDGLVVVYAEGILPAKTFIKATKIDYTGKMAWTMGDTIVTVSSVPGLTGGRLSEYVPADSQLVMSMSASASGRYTQLVQNIKNSQVTGGTLGSGTLRQVVDFDTSTLYVTYGDAVPYLGGTSSAGISPEYVVDDEDIATVGEDGNVEVIAAGTFHVYAYFPGTDVYVSKTSLAKTIVVRKRQLNVIAENKSIKYGHDIPQLTMTFHDFVKGDDVMSFTKLPTIVTPATFKFPIGIYPITLQGGVSSKYEPVLTNGMLTIYPGNGSDSDKLEAYCSSPSTLQVNIYSTTQQQGVLQLIDMTGKILWSQQTQVPNSITNIQIPVFNLAPAIYVVRFVGHSTILDQKVKIK